MSKYIIKALKSLVPYTPGEQPQDKKYIKLNTNESPFPPSKKAVKFAVREAEKLMLYPDPDCKELCEKLADYYRVKKENIIVTNGSDEVLNFAFLAFCDEKTPAAFPDITYGFYKVFAEINGVPFEEIPLRDDFSLNVADYCGIKKTIFIANPNAPTGIALALSEIEKIVKSNPENIVVIDEAYVDFGAESAVKLTEKYDNLLVTQTFSKSRSMAGARLGVGIGNAEIIKDLNTIRFSTNPYNINRMTLSCGIGVLEDDEYTKKNCQTIIKNREYLCESLKALGFSFTASVTNFVFARHNSADGEFLYKSLKEKGILVRHFNKDRLKEYIRITIGTKKQMETLVKTLKSILEEL